MVLLLKTIFLTRAAAAAPNTFIVPMTLTSKADSLGWGLSSKARWMMDSTPSSFSKSVSSGFRTSAWMKSSPSSVSLGGAVSSPITWTSGRVSRRAATWAPQ